MQLYNLHRMQCNARIITSLEHGRMLVALQSACFTNTKNLMFSYLHEWNIRMKFFPMHHMLMGKLLYLEFFILENKRKEKQDWEETFIRWKLSLRLSVTAQKWWECFLLTCKNGKYPSNFWMILAKQRYHEMAPPLSNWTWIFSKPLHRFQCIWYKNLYWDSGLTTSDDTW